MTGVNEFDWTESAILRLRDLWAEGRSTAEIGRRLGTTKNSVVGKSRRLDLPRRPSPIRAPNLPPSQTPDAIRRRVGRQYLAHRKRTLAPLSSLAGHVVAQPTPEPTFILPVNLSSRCCYVVDATRMQQRYCDAPAPLGSSWCIEHARQVFVADHFPDWCAKHHVRMEAVAA